MARTSNQQVRRTQIARACKTLLATHGYEGTTTVAIAHAAGLAPGLVHYHFASKEAILVAVVALVARELAERIAVCRASAAPAPAAQLHATLAAHVALGPDADPDGVAAWNVIVDEATRRPDVRSAVDAVLRADVELLQELVMATLGPRARCASRVEEIAAALLAAIHGYWQLARLAPKLVPAGSAEAGLRAMADGLLDAERRL